MEEKIPTPITSTLPAARVATGYTDLALDRYPRFVLHTSSGIDEEIFASLQYYSEVKEVGLKFVETTSGLKGKERDLAYELFQAFIRQGQTFYSSAEKLHHRASPLFYYYAFLNLAKAYIALRQPRVFEGKVGHGLAHDYQHATDLASEMVSVAKAGVFPLLYGFATKGKAPHKQSFNVLELLAYMTDISFEYEPAGYGTCRMASVKTRLLVNSRSSDKMDVWPVIAFSRDRMEGRMHFFSRCLDYFEEVDMSKENAERMFQLMAAERLGCRFFQGKKVYRVEDPDINESQALLDDARTALGSLLSPNVFPDAWDCMLALPSEGSTSVQLDEFLAGYVLFFYLGSLVRYHPDYLERLLMSKEAWIIQRFTSTCATTVLRRVSVLLLGENRVLCFRS